MPSGNSTIKPAEPCGLFMVNCGHCSHSADADHFAMDDNGQPLPSGEWRCPKCSRHIRMRPTGEDEHPFYGQREIIILREGVP